MSGLEKKINTLQRQIDSGCNNAKEKLGINIQLEEIKGLFEATTILHDEIHASV